MAFRDMESRSRCQGMSAHSMNSMVYYETITLVVFHPIKWHKNESFMGESVGAP